MEEGEEID